MENNKQMTGKESLDIINEMIQKAKATYHDKGISALLWGTVVTIASSVSFCQMNFNFSIGFDIWLIVLFAIIPQIIFSIKEGKKIKVKKYEDETIDIVWMVYGISIFCLVFYQNIIPYSSSKIINNEGWELTKHYFNNSTSDKVIKPFVPSVFSLYLILYALPTLVTGVIKKFKPMIFGAIICYAMFIISCFTESKYDMLCGATAAIFCWLIPGIILRKKYLQSKKQNV
ncbi:MAG: hypothetical protein ACOVO1_02875 [Chitinophagaceae bacterium]